MNKITLKQLVNNISFDDIWPILQEEYTKNAYHNEEDDNKDYYNVYKSVYEYLCDIKPEEYPSEDNKGPKIIINVSTYHPTDNDREEFGETESVEVCGIPCKEDITEDLIVIHFGQVCSEQQRKELLNNLDATQLILRYGLSFIPWSEWLALPIRKECFGEFTPEEILAHCMWEMTFNGFTPEDVENKRNDLFRACIESEEEYKKLQAGEESKLIDAGELLEELKKHFEEGMDNIINSENNTNEENNND